ncbi:Gfo/Idh/MocA family oxidoreductase [Candidatus Sumerlaeota bacterium]|nr:Gfo/Idh/MocA family oxidoreductase [Candidatus Sumerlaeota bacterium]
MVAKKSKKSQKNKQLRIGIIGAGMYVAAAHIPALRRFHTVKVVSACRKHPERLEKFCKAYNVPRGYTDYRKMLEKEKLDGVIIASPNYLHYEHTMACLKKGIPVLLEKPMTIKSTEAFEIHEYAQRNNIPVVIGYNRHYWANFCYAKKMIEEQQLGTIQYITVRWLADIEWCLARGEPPESFSQKAFFEVGGEPNFRGDPKLAGGGMFIDGGSNMLDAVCWLTELRPVEVFAMMENRGFATDCDTMLGIRFENDALCSCTVMGAAKTFTGHQIYVHGTKGSVYVDDYTIFYQLNGQKEVQVVDLPVDSCPTANFIRVLQGREKIHCSTKDGLRACIAVESAYKSSQEGRPIKIEKWV